MALSGCELRGLYQHMLDVFVALFGNGCPQHLVGRALLRSAQSAITDGLLDRPEARDIANLQSPRQRRDRTDAGYSPQAIQSLHKQRVTFQRADQGIVYLSDTEQHNGFANCLLWCCIKRSKFLPEGGLVPETDIAALADRLREVVKWARPLPFIRV